MVKYMLGYLAHAQLRKSTLLFKEMALYLKLLRATLLTKKSLTT
ncbi:hypothetical protein LINPERPRIM_LOCUS25841 [Linum perenne]